MSRRMTISKEEAKQLIITNLKSMLKYMESDNPKIRLNITNMSEEFTPDYLRRDMTVIDGKISFDFTLEIDRQVEVID